MKTKRRHNRRRRRTRRRRRRKRRQRAAGRRREAAEHKRLVDENERLGFHAWSLKEENKHLVAAAAAVAGGATTEDVHELVRAGLAASAAHATPNALLKARRARVGFVEDDLGVNLAAENKRLVTDNDRLDLHVWLLKEENESLIATMNRPPPDRTEKKVTFQTPLKEKKTDEIIFKKYNLDADRLHPVGAPPVLNDAYLYFLGRTVAELDKQRPQPRGWISMVNNPASFVGYGVEQNELYWKHFPTAQAAEASKAVRDMYIDTLPPDTAQHYEALYRSRQKDRDTLSAVGWRARIRGTPEYEKRVQENAGWAKKVKEYETELNAECKRGRRILYGEIDFVCETRKVNMYPCFDEQHPTKCFSPDGETSIQHNK